MTTPDGRYGQTNCWVGPELKYAAYEACNGEVFVCTEHCARNMSYQDLTPEFGKYVKLMDLTGMVCSIGMLKATCML